MRGPMLHRWYPESGRLLKVCARGASLLRRPCSQGAAGAGAVLIQPCLLNLCPRTLLTSPQALDSSRSQREERTIGSVTAMLAAR